MDDEFWNNLFQHTMSLFIDPEVTRRLEAAQIDKSWRMQRAQVIMNVGMPVQIRLNEEVKAVFRARFTGTGAPTIGRAVSADELGPIEGAQLTPADANAGHITLLFHKDAWFITVDLRYNRARILEYLTTVDQFLGAARDSLAKSRLRPFVDALFVSMEHLARCYLMFQPDETLLKRTSHGFVKTRFNRDFHVGNVDRTYVTTLNRLFELRNPARYMTHDFWIAPWEAEELLSAADRLRLEVEALLPPRYHMRWSLPEVVA